MTNPNSYREVDYTSADGRLRLFARDYPAKGGCERPALLMMHGLTRNSADFEPLIAQLDWIGRMIVPDQRGRGRSQYDRDPANYRPDIYVEDMWALLDHLGIDSVLCIGTSMGGLMSMMMGTQRPRAVTAIALNDIGPHVSEEGLDRIRSYVGASDPMDGWDAAARRCAQINRDALDGLDHSDWAAFARRTCEELPDGSVRFAYDSGIAAGMAVEGTNAVPPDLWQMWDALKNKPILAIRGAKSDILTAQTVAKMGQRHPQKFSSVEVAGRGHAPLLDEPEAVSAIARFLDENCK
ncbi:alpha/beta hydrolase [Erythrobacter sp. KY5]|uniref:alpha/beta fold hydrolase n=1 Tax=Erythrobacter sp. KY5 TaxID=2011159 RepID=UPI000DBF3167|nr:alpha/beta hydrolase [Erythrobacter sp. KY5]AWW75405.1 alpha/beta hydrolase [Erythrobacter sp. KY5]